MKLVFAVFVMAGSFAQASFNLANNGRKIVCYADDNQSWVLNTSRTTLKYTVEGESSGPYKIFDRKTDGRTFSSYSSDEGTLTLGTQKDTFQFAEADEEFEVNCQ